MTNELKWFQSSTKHDDFHLFKEVFTTWLLLTQDLEETKGGSDISFRCVTTLEDLKF